MERYKQLYKSDEFIYTENCPIIVEAIALLKDNKYEKLVGQTKLKNIDDRTITAVYLSAMTYGPTKEFLGEQEAILLDLNEASYKEFGQKIPINISNDNTRIIEIKVNKVLFENGDIWERNGTEMITLPKPQLLEEYFENEAQVKHYKQFVSSSAEYITYKNADIWRCTCGEINKLTHSSCNNCKLERSNQELYINKSVLNDEIYQLAVSYQEKDSENTLAKAVELFAALEEWKDAKDRLEQSQQALDKCIALRKRKEAELLFKENERKAKEEEQQRLLALQKAKVRKKKITIAWVSILAVILIALAAAAVHQYFIPNKNYTEAISLKEQGKYDEAIELLEKNNAWPRLEFLSSLSCYSGCNSEIEECIYLKAEKLFADGDMDSALAELKKNDYLDDYEDKHNDMVYRGAAKLAENGEFKESSELYYQVIDYLDAKQKYLEVKDKEADKLIQDNKYDEAVTVYENMNVKTDDDKINEVYYQKALQLIETQKYEEAREIFKNIDSYKDSKEQYVDATIAWADELFRKDDAESKEQSIEMLKEVKDRQGLNDKINDYIFELAEYYENGGNYSKALGKYTILKNLHYNDSNQHWNECKYKQGKQYIDNGSYFDGYTAFTAISGYSDADTLAQLCAYECGKSYYSENKLGDAEKYFGYAGDYSDAKSKMTEVGYQYAVKLYNGENYEAALNRFEKYKDYSDAATRILDCKYGYATKHLNNYDEKTYNYLNELKQIGYKDAATIYSDLYGWKIKLKCFNNSKNDDRTIKATTNRYATYLHFSFELSGGTPGEKVTLTHTSQYPGGSVQYSNWDWEDVGNGYTPGCVWKDGISWNNSGDLIINVYNKGNGQLLGTFSINLT